MPINEYRQKNSGTDWNRVVSSKSKVTITGLDPVKEYEFRVAYIGRNPQITYSDVVMSYVF
ncbi:fibronectin type III domain-containing protein [Sphingobacterium sp. SGR-19]|uniref:fibronectin type III domain-containing protein n=1 Tax=Sphingobacterium sp. SGR-19 TaxID=2710886 RepID=UPI0013E9BCDF|nr:fibronectin type III domain-containing protein [Sphingobacterium sp. SGR-19]NGM66128.1 fibronectin type III domain-containing protein [Sphingobacterium sp. SGR-19]